MSLSKKQKEHLNWLVSTYLQEIGHLQPGHSVETAVRIHKGQPSNSVMRTPISKIDFGSTSNNTRIIGACRSAGIKTVGALAKLGWDRLSSITNLGMVSCFVCRQNSP